MNRLDELMNEMETNPVYAGIQERYAAGDPKPFEAVPLLQIFEFAFTLGELVGRAAEERERLEREEEREQTEVLSSRYGNSPYNQFALSVVRWDTAEDTPIRIDELADELLNNPVYRGIQAKIFNGDPNALEGVNMGDLFQCVLRLAAVIGYNNALNADVQALKDENDVLKSEMLRARLDNSPYNRFDPSLFRFNM